MTSSTSSPSGISPAAIVRVDSVAAIPPPAHAVVDVAILDMNHGFPNIGHDAIVDAISTVARDLRATLDAGGRSLRIVSLAVRDKHVVPAAGRFGLLVGTGGPGHIDPNLNTAEGEDTIIEDGRWERPLHALFDAAIADERVAILGVCHTYGILCRWAGIADPILRDRVTGGKSIGVRMTRLTDASLAHPWFEQMVRALDGRRTFPVVDSRYYDLVPRPGDLPSRMSALGYEAATGDLPAKALTMVEFARTADGTTPRIFGVNHHPEVASSDDLERTLDEKLAIGEISATVHESRSSILAELRRPESDERARLIGSAYTFTNLIRYHVERLIAA